jgi:hypothetical protein
MLLSLLSYLEPSGLHEAAARPSWDDSIHDLAKFKRARSSIEPKRTDEIEEIVNGVSGS